MPSSPGQPRSSPQGKVALYKQTVPFNLNPPPPALTRTVASRAVSTEAMDSRQAMDLLNEQRAKRPSSPWHIYQPQLTSISSIANRATGAGLSVGTFIFFSLSAAHPDRRLKSKRPHRPEYSILRRLPRTRHGSRIRHHPRLGRPRRHVCRPPRMVRNFAQGRSHRRRIVPHLERPPPP